MNKEKEENGYNFNILFDKCTQRSMNLISKEQFEEWIESNFNIKTYIKIEDKKVIANLVSIVLSSQCGVESNNFFAKDSGQIEKYYDFAEIVEDYEILKIMFVLPKYLGINPFPIKFRTTDYYDLILSSGLYEYVSEKAKFDINKFEKMIDTIIGLENLQMAKLFEGMFDNLPTQEKLEEFEKTVKKLTPKKMQEIKDFTRTQDPITMSIVDGIKIDVLEKAVTENVKQIKNAKESLNNDI